MVGIQEPGRSRDDAVPVRVRVVAERDVEAVLEFDQAGHRIGTGAVHADLAIVIEGHEPEGGVELRIHHRDVQAELLPHRSPIARRRAAEGIDPDLQARRANGFHVNRAGQIPDIGGHEVGLVGRRGLAGYGVRGSFHLLVGAAQERVGPILNPPGHVGIGRTAVRRVVLEAAVLRWIMRRGDDDPVCLVLVRPAVADQDRVGDDRGRRDAVVALDEDVHAIGREHFQGRALGRWGGGVAVLAHEQRAINALAAAVVADRLRHGQNVSFGERAVERRATVPAGAKAHQLIGVTEVR